VTYRDQQRIADILAAIEAIRAHLLRGALSDGLISMLSGSACWRSARR
jgi:hypothetical protein